MTKPESAASKPGAWLGTSAAPTKFLLFRHGQTELSVQRRYSGLGDVALTAEGARQARAMGTRLASMDGVVTGDGIAPMISSPLRRARQTAETIAEAVDATVECHDGFREIDFGDWEGLTFREASERDPELHRKWLSDTSVEPSRGESIDAVFARVWQARDDLLQRYAGRTVVVVSHVTPIKAMLRLALGDGPSLFFRLHLDLASLSIVEFYPDGHSSVRLVNDISHWA